MQIKPGIEVSMRPLPGIRYGKRNLCTGHCVGPKAKAD